MKDEIRTGKRQKGKAWKEIQKRREREGAQEDGGTSRRIINKRGKDDKRRDRERREKRENFERRKQEAKGKEETKRRKWLT